MSRDMSLWLESHVSLGGHPKTRKLAHELSIGIPRAVGHLHLFWHWALSYAPDGDLSLHESHEIAFGAQWAGDPDAFVAALVASRFVDRQDGGGHAIHDWWEYAEKLLVRRQRDRERKAEERKAPDSVRGTSEGRPKDVSRTNQPDRTNRTTTTADDGLYEDLKSKGPGLSDEDARYGVSVVEDARANGTEVANPIAYARKAITNRGQAPPETILNKLT